MNTLTGSKMENISLNTDDLLSLKKRIEDNTAIVKDYENLDFFLSSINLGGYILQSMKEKGYLNYQNFIDQRNKKTLMKDNASEAFIFGTIMECISLLLNNKV